MFPNWECVSCVIVEKEAPYSATVRFMAAFGDEEFRSFVVIDTDFHSEPESVPIDSFARTGGLLLTVAKLYTEEEIVEYMASNATRKGLHDKRFFDMAADVLVNMMDLDLAAIMARDLQG
jgi:hypothetical protein